LEKNKLCFNTAQCKSVKSLGLQIINLTSFWCKHIGIGNIFKLALVLSQTANDLCNQISCPLAMVMVHTQVMEDLVENPSLELALHLTFGNTCN
jgi:hypothetical protein